MWSLHALPMLTWVPSRYTGFLPLSKDMDLEGKKIPPWINKLLINFCSNKINIVNLIRHYLCSYILHTEQVKMSDRKSNFIPNSAVGKWNLVWLTRGPLALFFHRPQNSCGSQDYCSARKHEGSWRHRVDYGNYWNGAHWLQNRSKGQRIWHENPVSQQEQEVTVCWYHSSLR